MSTKDQKSEPKTLQEVQSQLAKSIYEAGAYSVEIEIAGKRIDVLSERLNEIVLEVTDLRKKELELSDKIKDEVKMVIQNAQKE